MPLTNTPSVVPLDSLSRALGITWTEITPSSSLKAFEVAQEWLDDGAIFLARFRQPMLVFGYEKTSFEADF